MNSKYPFLDLLDKQLDDAQSQALESIKNSVIAAGAGSGKTQVLATRFSWLVMTKQAKADQILTLTFTNKAAAEMYQRIYQTLLFFASQQSGPNLTEEEIQLAKEGLSDFANSHIQTLDSYCSNIVRQCSNRYGIKPDFSLASSDGERQIKDMAFKFIMQNSQDPGIKTFVNPGKLQDFAEKEIAKTIIKHTSLASPDNFFTSKLPVQLKELCNALKFYFSDDIKENDNFIGKKNLAKSLDEIREEFEVSFDPKKQLEYKTKIDKAAQIFYDQLSIIKIEEKDISEKSQKLEQFCQSYKEFKKALLSASSMGSGYNKKVRSIVTKLKDEVLPALDSILAYFNQFESLVSLYKLMDQFLKQVKEVKLTSGELTFVDVSQLALKILIENKDIREQEIAAYTKIMIDEFQDNNGQNRDMLYILSLQPGQEIDSEKEIYPQIIQKDTEGNIIKDLRQKEKLFFVGDEKQSIYKFRGAEVSVFNELTSKNENGLVSMSYNYRSTPELLQAFNLIFKNGEGIFKTYLNEKERLDYEAYYDKDARKFNPKLKKEEELPSLTAQNVPIHIRFVDTTSLSDLNEEIDNPQNLLIPADDQIAYNIAKRIYEMGKDKKNWKDFAILDKSRTHRSSITKYLSLFNIPYQVDQFNNIFEDGLISDFYNFFRICVYPSDINAYAAYLTSPFAALSENSVELILSHLVNIDDYDFVFDPFAPFDQEIKADLSSSQYEKYQNALNFYKENKSMILQQKLTDSLNLLWNKKGYKYETMLTSQTDLCAEQFDMLFELARQTEENGKSLAWFIDQLENLQKALSSDDADLDAGDISYPLERSQAVQIMTIHKSKGLQFEHVFLCACTNVKSKTEKGNIFFDKKTGISIKADEDSPNYFAIYQQELEKLKEVAEFRRLIYVGITRAIQDVYVMGSWSTKESKNESKSQLRIFEDLVKNTYGKNSSTDLCYIDGKAFDFQNLELVSYSQTRINQNTLNMDKIREERLSNVSKAFETAPQIVYENNAIPKSCPSALEKDFDAQTSEDAERDANQTDSKEAGRLHNPNFTAADFGTLVHAFLEAQALGINAEDFVPPVNLLRGLNSQSDKEKILKDCKNFCQLFTKTSLGQEFQQAKDQGRFYRAEWGFKMYWQETLWTGSIDLIYQKADGTYQIVDYKSDNKVDEEKYIGQQNCYKVAAAKMLGTTEEKVNCKLWFMKENKIIDL